MKYNTIVTDLDRTLLKTNKTISEYTIKILEECRKKGFNIIVASARPQRNITKFHEIINFDAIVASNGARVIKNNKIIEHKIPYESAKKILDNLKEKDFQITLETGDKAYSNVKLDYFETIITNDLEDILKKEGCLKIVIGIKNEKTYNLINSLLDDDVYCTVANNYVIQIMNKNATKWEGINKVLEMSKLDSKKCIYFGDDFDDIKPIDNCGYGVAMENAIPECKNVSNYICDTNDNDGVAKFLENFILKEEK